MFEINNEKSFLNSSLQPEEVKNEPFREFKNIVRRPLTSADPKNTEFGSLKGRAVCVLKFGQALLMAPIQMLKTALAIVACLFMSFVPLLDFNKEGLKGFRDLLVISLAYTLSAVTQPLSFVSDLTKLAAGAIIHPKIAIKEVSPCSGFGWSNEKWDEGNHRERRS